MAHDKKGRPVSGLKKEDFTLLERGRVQKIALFTADSEEEVKPNRPVKLPPDVYSNRAQPGPGQISVILFDSLNMLFADQAYARSQVLRFVRQVQPADLVALYSLTPKDVRVLHDFTNDQDQLAKALAGYRTSPSAALNTFQPAVSIPTGSAALDRAIGLADGGMSLVYAEFRAEWTLDAMADIAHHIAALPGRKNLIWVSGSFPLSVGISSSDDTDGLTGAERSIDADGLATSQRRLYEKALRTTRAITDASIAIYPVDARGVMVNPAFSASNSNLSSRTFIGPFVPTGHDTMELLAERTGGRAFINRNDVDGMIQDAVKDARVTYTLGFYSTEEDWDGKFHEIEVKVNRPDIELRYRKGFFAAADPVPNSGDLKSEVSSVLDSTLEATSIGLSTHVDASDSSKLSLTLHVAPEDVYFAQENARWVGSLEFVFAQFDPEGGRLDEIRQPLALSFTQPNYRQVLQQGLILTKAVDLVANADVLKIVVVDSSTGRVGSLKIPLKSK